MKRVMVRLQPRVGAFIDVPCSIVEELREWLRQRRSQLGHTLACLPVTAKGRFQHFPATGWPRWSRPPEEEGPRCASSELDLLRNAESVVDLDSEIANGAFELRMSE